MKNEKVKCPQCGKLAEKRGKWKMSDGSHNRLYVHETEIRNGFPFVTKSCVVNEPKVQS